MCTENMDFTIFLTCDTPVIKYAIWLVFVEVQLDDSEPFLVAYESILLINHLFFMVL
jgi:hypothetical protein